MKTSARHRRTLLTAFARQHADAAPHRRVAGAAALASHLDAGARLSDALVAADRAVTDARPPRAPRWHRRTARGRGPAVIAPVWLLARLAERRHERAA